jgi:hypothetical protein
MDFDGRRTAVGNKSSFINDIFVIYDFINDIIPSGRNRARSLRLGEKWTRHDGIEM